MDTANQLIHPVCAVGTMAWGKSFYSKSIMGSCVAEETLAQTVRTASELGLTLFDTAGKYGMGYAEKVLGRYASEDIRYSDKFTPLGPYHRGGVRKSLEKSLRALKRDSVDIFWLHLPKHIKENLEEICTLAEEGLIKNIGVSNFNAEEIAFAQNLVEERGRKLYGVQNHYSLLNREWEKNGVLKQCADNGILFFAWSPLEGGALSGNMHFHSASMRGMLANKKLPQLEPLFETMRGIGEKYDINIAGIAYAWLIAKGVVPIAGARTPDRILQLKQAVETKLTPEEVEILEQASDRTDMVVYGADMFRFGK